MMIAHKAGLVALRNEIAEMDDKHIKAQREYDGELLGMQHAMISLKDHHGQELNELCREQRNLQLEYDDEMAAAEAELRKTQKTGDEELRKMLMSHNTNTISLRTEM